MLVTDKPEDFPFLGHLLYSEAHKSLKKFMARVQLSGLGLRQAGAAVHRHCAWSTVCFTGIEGPEACQAFSLLLDGSRGQASSFPGTQAHNLLPC